MSRGILFFDANTIWHRRLAEALGPLAPTLAFLPRQDLRLRRDPLPDPAGRTVFAAIGLPPGWAHRTAPLAQPILARAALRAARRLPDPVAILASPAYAPLARILAGRLPLVAYCADDYRSYAGWADAARREAEIMRRADLAVFVSEALRQRAVAEYGLDPAATMVSPNATEPRFGPPAPPLPEAVRDLKRPVLGLLGALGPRLDLDTVRRAAELEAVGTLLVAGPLDAAPAAQALATHPKIHVTGRLPHDEMHAYAHAMDAALIPYATGALNRHCSPMRLYDHLATGVPIFALDTCDQIVRLAAGPAGGRIAVAAAEPLLAAIAARIGAAAHDRAPRPELWADRAGALVRRLSAMQRADDVPSQDPPR